jgi:hypothetical protein
MTTLWPSLAWGLTSERGWILTVANLWAGGEPGYRYGYFVPGGTPRAGMARKAGRGGLFSDEAALASCVVIGCAWGINSKQSAGFDAFSPFADNARTERLRCRSSAIGSTSSPTGGHPKGPPRTNHASLVNSIAAQACGAPATAARRATLPKNRCGEARRGGDGGPSFRRRDLKVNSPIGWSF